jgi:hypothetical protein
MNVNIIKRLNLIRMACDHIASDSFTPKHHMAIGAVVMVVGVAVSKGAGAIHYIAIEFMGDIVGYLIHGIGCVPFIESFVAAAQSKPNDVSMTNWPKLPTDSEFPALMRLMDKQNAKQD